MTNAMVMLTVLGLLASATGCAAKPAPQPAKISDFQRRHEVTAADEERNQMVRKYREEQERREGDLQLQRVRAERAERARVAAGGAPRTAEAECAEEARFNGGYTEACLARRGMEDRFNAARSVGCSGETPVAIVAARGTPEALRVVKSADLCLQQLVKAQAQAAIAKERRYAKQYGVLDLGEINSNKFEIEEADERMATARAALAPLGGPLACASAFVADVMSCEIPNQGDVIRYAFDFNACQCAGRGLPGLQ